MRRRRIKSVLTSAHCACPGGPDRSLARSQPHGANQPGQSGLALRPAASVFPRPHSSATARQTPDGESRVSGRSTTESGTARTVVSSGHPGFPGIAWSSTPQSSSAPIAEPIPMLLPTPAAGLRSRVRILAPSWFPHGRTEQIHGHGAKFAAEGIQNEFQSFERDSAEQVTV